LYGACERKVGWSCVDTGGGDGAGDRTATGDGVDAPGDRGVCGAGDGGGEGCVLPKRSEAVAGVMVTVTEEEGGGGGGGGTTTELALAPPVLPAQPSVQAAAPRRMRSGSAAKRGPAAV